MNPTVTLILLLVTVVTCQYPFAYNYPQFANQQYNYYSNPRTYDRYGNPNVVNRANGPWGGFSNHGWSQVPRYHSPQFAPVYGKK